MTRFTAFLSYAHFDFELDKSMLELLVSRIESEVNACLVNAQLVFWQAINQLRIGDQWSDEIANAIESSDVLIVLQSPKWISSEYCCKEYEHFVSMVESRRSSLGKFVVPIILREVKDQARYFTTQQKTTYDSLCCRQYAKVRQAAVLQRNESLLNSLAAEIADDIVAMLERIRRASPPVSSSSDLLFERAPREFNRQAHNLAEVEVISDGEVVIDSATIEGFKSVYAYVEFIPKLYIQTDLARVDFAIRRAYLSISDGGTDTVRKWIAQVDVGSAFSNVRYVRLRERPDDLTVCIDPVAGSKSLAELPLKPEIGENRLSKVGQIKSSYNVVSLSATVELSLNAESLIVLASGSGLPTGAASLQKKIEVIVAVAVQKGLSDERGKIQRQLSVRERS